MVFFSGELHNRLEISVNNERQIKDECVNLRSKVSDLESELSSIKHKYDMTIIELEESRTEREFSEQRHKR